ncbi:DUF2177 family protein [Chenggangzhangella methanolivorans]|uniref:DUF2177 family protein n=1 Tax=Chenggangzhangella methanolivorans TaxID=1437009 RepID=A0A9E6R7V2_9HYPH|nr:DUF2177 family protein [Chenggangzhangella methanolivorans]
MGHERTLGSARQQGSGTTSDLTNLAAIRGFPTTLALVDLASGTVLSAVAATIRFSATRDLSG